MVDEALRGRVRSTVFGVIVRSTWLAMAIVALLFIPSALSGDWLFIASVAIAIAAYMGVAWLSAMRAGALLPLGSWIAYAVTPDGTLHTSTAVGVMTVNPGYVTRLAGTRQAWVLRLSSGIVLFVPRELLPDADAALLVRHLPGRFSPPAASTA